MRIHSSPHILVQKIDGESVLLNVQTNICFGLDDVGTRMWDSLTTTSSVEEALADLLAYYEVDAEQLRTDLMDFINQLVEQDLLRLSEDE